MTMLWEPDHIQPPSFERGRFGLVKAAVKALGIILLIACGVVVLGLLRAIEVPFYGKHRPYSPHVTQFVCRNTLRIIGITYRTEGQPMNGPGAVVANHTSWLDIFVLNARKRIYFVAKSEVAGWPGIGFLAKITGTAFVRRDRKEARAQVDMFRERLSLGHRLLFFPEGTSTDGRRVLPFKPTLFASFLTPELHNITIQPVSVVYRAADGADKRQYGWWGDMDFGSNLIEILASRQQGSVTVVYHTPVHVAGYSDRKRLAGDLERTVRSSLINAGVLEDV